MWVYKRIYKIKVCVEKLMFEDYKGCTNIKKKEKEKGERKARN